MVNKSLLVSVVGNAGYAAWKRLPSRSNILGLFQITAQSIRLVDFTFQALFCNSNWLYEYNWQFDVDTLILFGNIFIFQQKNKQNKTKQTNIKQNKRKQNNTNINKHTHNLNTFFLTFEDVSSEYKNVPYLCFNILCKYVHEVPSFITFLTVRILIFLRK